MATFKIGKRTLGEGHPCFIIAEAGINHNGDLKIAKKMVDVAAKAGADAIKFQTFKAEEVVNTQEEMIAYRHQGKLVKESFMGLLRSVELAYKEWRELAAYAKAKDILFFSTPQNMPDLRMLMKIGVPAIKVGSDDLTCLPQLAEYAKTRLPMIVSTGMAYLSEVDEAVRTILPHNPKLAVLHCVSLYPAEFEELNLRRIETLKSAYPNVVVGFSDHSRGITAPLVAVALGAKVLEKHFTLDRGMKGPDHGFALESDELRQLVREVRNAEASLGSSVVEPVGERELKERKESQRSLVAVKDITKGEKITKENVAPRRPGTGLPPKFLLYLLGKKATRDIKAHEFIRLESIQ
ncbi:MAG: N-acetylneuraminate synthase [Candidatus Wildermuthbacteria bacterium RIFCSPHIGHO2_02_FULL_49_9]|uniref:N-acetylneuraminate synthase n=2 Tax=Candidatus Wildermuthiibacteriota TaxID=1817923 RepID=A0A1G2R2B0_9BACT|nr:MAG: N-acetylneuraminate synthase [Candidatus Wildermuthbacteria bacterium RIFCSPHIGHO2_01_FULL_49_22b]OHA70643.1 MAG: N-acetylneuraminate synthase [Candidatus Wildermuthbacteria bacterium RIFCSPHIGHO2_02_FULL_49_9]